MRAIRRLFVDNVINRVYYIYEKVKSRVSNSIQLNHLRDSKEVGKVLSKT